jgi:hypothetical protein
MNESTRAINRLAFEPAALSGLRTLNERIRNNKYAEDHPSRFARRKFFALRFALLSALFLAILAYPLAAQTAEKPVNSEPWTQAYDASHEISIEGTVQEVVAHRIPGSPVGLHVIVNAPQGPLDVHLGPYMSKAIAESLQFGTSIGIVGSMMQVNGRDYLLARQINLNGQTVTLRAESGVLLRKVNRDWQTSTGSPVNGGVR